MASRICRLLHEDGCRVVVGACAGSKMEERARAIGIHTLQGLHLRRGFHPLHLWQDVSLLRRTIRAEHVNVVHAWHSIEYWTSALAVMGTEAKLVRTRGLVTPIKAHLFNRMVHRRTAAVFVTCERIRRLYQESGFGMANVFLLKDGVDTTAFRPGQDRATARQKLDLPQEAFVVASVGRLEAVKDQATLLSTLPALPGSVHAVLAGDGSLRETLSSLARELGIAARVHFLGVRNDIPEVLAAADAYVLCSVGSEGSSRATLEAMACAVPCVTTSVGMLPDIIQPEETGLRFSPGDRETLAASLRRLLEDKNLCTRLGQAGLTQVQANHTEEHMLQQIRDVYARISAQGQD